MTSPGPWPRGGVSSGGSPVQPSLVPEVDPPGGPSRTIGEVLAALRPAFPELSISKIRFYETQGLLTPERTASGYRKFSAADVARLRYILTAARDHYLPLKVIRAQLEALDRGETPAAAAARGLAAAERLAEGPGLDPDAATAERTDVADGTDVGDQAVAETSLPDGEALPVELRPEAFAADASELRLSRPELVRASGLTGDQLAELEQYGLLATRPGSSYFDGDALVIAKIVAQMSRYGLEARHLRPVKAAADREVGLVEQVVNPLSRQRAPGARAQAAQAAREMASLSVRLHAALVSAGLRSALRG